MRSTLPGHPHTYKQKSLWKSLNRPFAKLESNFLPAIKSRTTEIASIVLLFSGEQFKKRRQRKIASDLPMIVLDSITGNTDSTNRALWFCLDCFDNVSVFYSAVRLGRSGLHNVASIPLFKFAYISQGATLM